MPPGTYNGYYINSSVIKESFSNTNWNMKELRSLYSGHPQDPLPTEWVGEIQNPHFDEEMGGLRGDNLKIGKGQGGVPQRATGQIDIPHSQDIAYF